MTSNSVVNENEELDIYEDTSDPEILFGESRDKFLYIVFTLHK